MYARGEKRWHFIKRREKSRNFNVIKERWISYRLSNICIIKLMNVQLITRENPFRTTKVKTNFYSSLVDFKLNPFTWLQTTLFTFLPRIDFCELSIVSSNPYFPWIFKLRDILWSTLLVRNPLFVTTVLLCY